MRSRRGPRARPTASVRPSVAGAVVCLVLAALTAACTASSGPADVASPSASTRPPGPTVPLAPSVTVDAQVSETWTRLPLGAGGWVTGLVIDPSGVVYARTDVGGAYRYDATTSRWRQLLVVPGVPDARPDREDYAVESIAVSPANPDVVLVSVGNDFNPADGEPLPSTGRVLRSTDGGVTWRASNISFFAGGNQAHRQRSERLAIDPADPRHVFLGTRRQGLWSSTDGGATFTQVSPTQVPVGTVPRPEADHAGVTFVSFDATAPGRVYVGVAGVGVLRSDDGGATWRTAVDARGANDVPFEGTVTSGRLLVSMSIIEGDGDGTIGLYDPATGQVTSIRPDARASAWSGAIDPNDPRHIVVTEDAVRSGHLWRSLDGGATWRTLEVRIDASSIPWLDRTDLVEYMSLGRLVFDPKVRGRLWFAEGMGVWRTDDFVDTSRARDSVTFTLDSRGIEELVIADVVAPPDGAAIVVAADRQGFRITDVRSFPSAPLVDRAFAGGTDVDYSGGAPKSLVWIGAEYQLYFDPARRPRGAVSSDGGITWTEMPNLTKDMFGGNVAMSAGDPKNIVWLPSYFLSPFEYLQQPKGIYVTADGGRTWRHLTPDGRDNYHRLMWWLTRQALVADKVDGGVFYLQSDTEDFVVSTDGGATWRRAPHSSPCTESVTCHVYGQLVASPSVAGEVWSGVGDAGLYVSLDRGQTPWTRVAGVEAVRAFGLGAPLVAGGPSAVYLYGRVGGDPDLGIWRSADRGATWELLGRAPLGLYTSITSITGDPSHPGRVYVGFGGNGVVMGESAR